VIEGLSSRRYAEERDRKIKERIFEFLMSKQGDYGVDTEEEMSLLEKLVEWLEEDYGMRVEKSWNEVREAAVSSKEVKSRELAAFLVSEGIQVDESYWLEQ